MKLTSPISKLIVGCSLVGGVLLTAPVTGQARDKDDHHSKHSSHHHHHYSHDAFFSYPRTSWSVSFGTGYAGAGYYYGPPDADYYYEGSGVAYYPRRELVPSRYYGSSYGSVGSVDASVQAALARRGYNPGPVDGELGPMSRRAIMRFQADHGLAVTGTVNSNLLRSLGI